MEEASPEPPPGYAQCRFCLEEVPREELLSPCQCTGTGSYVHEECLRRWQVKVCAPGDTRAFICQACRTPYKLAPPPPIIGRAMVRPTTAPQESPTPLFEQIFTSPYFERSDGGFLGSGLRRRVKECIRPGCLVLRAPGASEIVFSAEHWHQSVFLIGGVWPGRGHGQSDALIGVNLVGTTIGYHGELPLSGGRNGNNLLWGLPIRTRRGGPCQQRRSLLLVSFSGALTTEMPPLVRLVTPDPPVPSAESSSVGSTARDGGPATDGTAAGPPRCCSGALFGEPQDVFPVLRRETGIRILQAVAFQGHTVWSSTQLLSEVIRGEWGLARATSSDLLVGLAVEERAAYWRQLWHTKEPVRAGSDQGTRICTIS